MNWDLVYPRIQQMQGMNLQSISGKSDIQLVSIDATYYVIRRQDGVEKRKRITRLRAIAEAMQLGAALHVDSTVLGSGSSRSHPETILANLPDVEWVRINNVKRILWVGQDTHALGTLQPST
jgi:hypothetical protein